MKIKTYVIPTVLALVLGLSQAAPVYAQDSKDKKEDKAQIRVENLLKSRLPGLEVSINSNGKVLVRGAKVTSVSGNQVTATTGWGSSVLTWNVTTDGSTKFLELNSRNSQIADVKVGDTVSFQGDLVTTVSSPLTVRATVLKDWSRGMVMKTTLEGTAKTIPGTTTAPAVFTLTSGNTDFQVRISSLTSVLNSLWLRLPLGALKIGDKIRVYGAVNADNTVDATVVRDVTAR